MAVLQALLVPLQVFNDTVLRIGRGLAVVALAIMVCFILFQVVMRYSFNAAPNWTEEGARFLMLWMTGLIAPSAYRLGGFVAIDMLERALARWVSALLILALLLISFVVLIYGVQLGWDNIFSLSGRGKSASLRLPLDWFGGERIKFKNNWAFASLFVGMALLMLVNIELILRQMITLGGGEGLRPLQDPNVARAD